ncbi:ribosome biogenesis protein [Candidatus Woesearchaeota archaeon]|nr:ribosome biogenesis protein [Candidatus Woesearchaeota archaeon]
MAKHIMYCSACKTYTMKSLCTCGAKTGERKPAKYSPDDKYAQYRREVKSEQRKKEGLV